MSEMEGGVPYPRFRYNPARRFPDMQETAAQLATAVVTILAPYAAKTAREFVETLGETAYQRAKGLMDSLKRRWSSQAEDKEAAVVLEQFEKKPERYEPVLRDVLEEKIAADPELAGDLTGKVRELGPVLEIVQRLSNAEGVTGLEAKEMKAGKAAITQDIEGGRNITGAKIDRIG
jgi:hypothetical protein